MTSLLGIDVIFETFLGYFGKNLSNCISAPHFIMIELETTKLGKRDILNRVKHFSPLDYCQSVGQQTGVHFVLRRKNAGNFELVSLVSKSHATVVSVPGGGSILRSSLYDICCLLSYKFRE